MEGGAEEGSIYRFQSTSINASSYLVLAFACCMSSCDILSAVVPRRAEYRTESEGRGRHILVFKHKSRSDSNRPGGPEDYPLYQTTKSAIAVGIFVKSLDFRHWIMIIRGSTLDDVRTCDILDGNSDSVYIRMIHS